jgi:pentose-5-phosphate-3-epimerase
MCTQTGVLVSKFFTLSAGAAASAEPPPDRSLQVIRALGKKAGVSLNPAPPEAAIEHVLDRLDLIPVMSVNPGFGGQSFIEAQLEKIRRVRRMIGDRPIELEVDGGADDLVAGSAVSRATTTWRRSTPCGRERVTGFPWATAAVGARGSARLWQPSEN